MQKKKRPLITMKDFAWTLYLWPGYWLAGILPIRLVRSGSRSLLPFINLAKLSNVKDRNVLIGLEKTKNHFNDLRAAIASSAPWNFGFKSRAFFNSLFAFSFSPFLLFQLPF
jgi:hypothetical protein